MKNRKDLIDMTTEKVTALGTTISRRQVEVVIATLFDADGGTILDCLKSEGSKLSINKFGSFEAVARPARIGRNPKTGEPVHIQERTRVRFSASSVLIKQMDK